MRTITVNEAVEYLKANPFESLRVKFNNQTRRIFYNKTRGLFGMYYKGATRRGHLFNWEDISAIFAPKDEAEECRKLTAKFIREAQKATFTNNFIRECLEADVNKSPYENHLTVGCLKDGEIITLSAIAKVEPFVVEHFRKALKEREDYCSYFFDFRGYDCHLSLTPITEDNIGVSANNKIGDIYGYLSLEYRGTGNGHYYTLINDEKFIYVEKD